MEQRTESEGFEGCWAVIRNAGGSYVGRVATCWNPNALKGKWVVVDDDPERRHLLLEATTAKMDPAYEFICQPQIQPTPQGPALVGKLFFAVSIGATIKDSGLYLNLNGALIQLLAQMHESDAQTYKDLVRQARAQMAEASKQAAAERAGIILTGSMPGERGGGRFRA